ncbi:MAG: Fis family two component sigma-54 specific transcriptional regulator [Stygiobacter sp.]|nr:MAG: Fis family two component sigma-54 specific transcriptional regulator [Stygiobacter sp.]KAF0211405.1 MAG: Fis family two component sigma-54 specific transcriptional [Ignavibacteria bacterium]
MTKILLIDDNQAVLNFLRILLLQKDQYEVETLQDSTKAYDLIEQGRFDVLILDMDMPNVSGLDILKYIQKNKIVLKTIVLTGVEDIDLAISAMKLGTYDYMLKPVDEVQLFKAIETVVHEKELLKKGEIPHKLSLDSLKYKEVFQNVITQDENMIKIFHVVEKFAETDNSVLIWGESGSGKELIAQAIHQISNRRDKNFVAVNAGAFAHELFSSEFFGHEKGAFTGASRDKIGFIEEADGGTLFLDEIGELSLPIQVKLLRVLQEEEFYRLGSTKNIKADVRIIAATNKNLFDEIRKGSFRKDLFFRLNINSINLPALRDRKGDIELLANYFLEKFNSKYKRNIKRISDSLLACLKSYSFPGNVRELMNLINSAIIVETGDELKKKSLPNYFLENNNSYGLVDRESAICSLEEVEKEHIRKILKFANNNRTKAAEILGISRVNLIAKIKKYSLDKAVEGE